MACRQFDYWGNNPPLTIFPCCIGIETSFHKAPILQRRTQKTDVEASSTQWVCLSVLANQLSSSGVEWVCLWLWRGQTGGLPLTTYGTESSWWWITAFITELFCQHYDHKQCKMTLEGSLFFFYCILAMFPLPQQKGEYHAGILEGPQV